MTLSGSLQIAGNALFAAQVGLQVTGNNIANANTPGYLRQEAVLETAGAQKIGDLNLGLGVHVAAIVQKTDRFLAERLRSAISDLANAETQEGSYLQLESLIGELSESDLSTSLTDFLAAIHNVLNQPDDLSVRSFAVLQGKSLASNIRRTSEHVTAIRADIDTAVISTADDLNRLLEEVAKLNVQIVVMEGGTTAGSDAVGLRDQREAALAKLAEIVGVHVVEQPDSSVAVYAGGDYLVFAGDFRRVNISYSQDESTAAATVHLQDTDSPLAASSGRLAGLYATRDEILGGFLEDLDGFAETLEFEFNKVYTSGQGLVGHHELLSEFRVNDSSTALDQAGLLFTPVNGSFQVLVRNTRTGVTKTSDVFVGLQGLEDDTTLSDLASTLTAIDGLQAEVTSLGELRLASDSPEVEFAFANDTSGVLASLGLGGFFTGSSATDLDVSDLVRDDPSLFAASRGGIGADAENAVLLADFGDQPLESQDGRSLLETYGQMVARVTQGSSLTQAAAEGYRAFQQTLEGQYMGITGVSIDDEAIKMIAYQRAYQAAARYIATINELLGVLVSL